MIRSPSDGRDQRRISSSPSQDQGVTRLQTTRLARNNVGIALLSGIGAVYFLAFPAHILECDAVMFAYGALHSDMVFMGYAHHLGYNLLQYAAAAIGQGFTPPLSPIYILQYLSVAAGLGGILILYRFFIRLRIDRTRAILYSGVLLFSYAYSHYSRQADTHIIAAFLLIWFLSSFERFLRSPSPAAGAVSGLILGMATVMHQSNILLLPAVLAGTLCARKERRSLISVTGLLLGVYLAIAVVPYPIVGRRLAGTQTLGEFRVWVLGTSEWGGWGAWRLDLLPATAVGLVRSFTGSHYVLDFTWVASLANRLFRFASFEDEMAIAAAVPDRLRYPLLVVQAGVVAFALRALVKGPIRLRHLFRVERPLGLFLTLWIVVFGVFFAWWAPERVEFWIAWFIPVITVLARPAAGEATAKGPRRFVPVAFLAALVFVNFFGSIYPQSGPIDERDTAVAVALDTVVDKGDIVVGDCSFEGRASRYVISFEKINLLDPGPDSLSVGGPQTVYRFRAGQRYDAVVASERMLEDLAARAVGTVDSLVVLAEAQHRTVYLLVSPVSVNPTRASIYKRLVDAIGKRFDISEAVPVRGGIDLRKVLRFTPGS